MHLLQDVSFTFPGQYLDPGLVIPVVAITLGILGIGLPATALGIGHKWSETRPDLAGGILGGAIFISAISILVGGVIILATMGWLPPPTQW